MINLDHYIDNDESIFKKRTILLLDITNDKYKEIENKIILNNNMK